MNGEHNGDDKGRSYRDLGASQTYLNEVAYSCRPTMFYLRRYVLVM